MQKYLFMAIGLGLIFMSIMAFQEGKPSLKAPIYKEVKQYSPYYLEKRFGGLQIRNKENEKFKEKPVNVELFRRLEYLEKTWGQTHLKIKETQLTVLDNNGTNVATIAINNEQDAQFLHSYYGI